MSSRPYVLLSASLSLDGYLDNASHRRLILSNSADLDRVDAERATADAILVGAGTVRADNPRLLVRSHTRRAQRVARGLAPSPMKVTLTAGGALDPAACFFQPGDAKKVVFSTSSVASDLRRKLAGLATVVDGGTAMSMEWVLESLGSRGVGRLMVEGGSQVHTQLLSAGLADELQLVMAPLFVGDSRAPRFVGDGRFPWDEHRRAELADVRRIGDVVLLRYALSARFNEAAAQTETARAASR